MCFYLFWIYTSCLSFQLKFYCSGSSNIFLYSVFHAFSAISPSSEDITTIYPKNCLSLFFVIIALLIWLVCFFQSSFVFKIVKFYSVLRTISFMSCSLVMCKPFFNVVPSVVLFSDNVPRSIFYTVKNMGISAHTSTSLKCRK